MKAKKVFQKVAVAMVLFLATTVFSNVYAQKYTTYAYGIATYYNPKIVYVSNIASFTGRSRDLHAFHSNAWINTFKRAVDDWHKYSTTSFSDDNYDELEDEREERISDYRKSGYTIKYINSLKSAERDY